jgi:hypothetical protein
MFKRILPLLVLPLFLAGCAAEMTNLTAQRKVREANNLYSLEVAVDSEQQTLRCESIHPQILVGTESYPMQPTPLMTNRWEGVVPIPPGTTTIQYRFKLDYQYNAFGKPKNGTALSKTYKMQIVEP